MCPLYLDIKTSSLSPWETPHVFGITDTPLSHPKELQDKGNLRDKELYNPQCVHTSETLLSDYTYELLNKRKSHNMKSPFS